MADQSELAQLEAEHDRLLTMIAYHNRPFFRVPPGRAPAWFATAISCGIGIWIVAEVLAGQISAPAFLILVVALPLLAYILSRKLAVFGITFRRGDAVTTGRPAGEAEARQRLADCEARILKLKEGRRW
jgi:hypothetical protein